MPGEHEPEMFWQPVFADRFGLLPWDIDRVWVAHYDSMLSYVKRVPSFG